MLTIASLLDDGLMIENLTMFLSELYTSSFLSKSLSILKLMVLIMHRKEEAPHDDL